MDEGILVKTGFEVLISARNAFEGTDLVKLHESVEKEFKNLDEQEKDVRSAVVKLESGFMRTFEKFRRD